MELSIVRDENCSIHCHREFHFHSVEQLDEIEFQHSFTTNTILTSRLLAFFFTRFHLACDLCYK